MRASRRGARSARAPLLAGALVALAAASAPAAHAEPAVRLTLREAVAMALEQGYGARIARLEAARAADERARVRGAFLPRLWLTSNAGYSNRLDEKLRVLDPQGVPRTYGLATLGATEGWLNVFVDQVLLDLRQWREAERAELAAGLAELREAERREAIAHEVVVDFAHVLRLEELAASLRGGEEEARWLDEQAGSLLGAGRALASEREAVAIHLEQARLEVAARAGELEAARRALWLAASGSESPPPGLALDAAGIPAPGASPSPEELEQALAGSPSVRALGIARAIEEKGVESARAGRFPTVGLRGGWSHYGVKRYDSYDDELLVGVDVRVPIFDGLDARHATAGAEKSAAIARLEANSLLAERRARARELARLLELAGARIDLAARAAASAQEELRVADLGLRAGRGSLAASLAARARAGDARAAAVEARFAGLALWADLERELGRLAAAVAAP
jgi:outer membrane protein TolC